MIVPRSHADTASLQAGCETLRWRSWGILRMRRLQGNVSGHFNCDHCTLVFALNDARQGVIAVTRRKAARACEESGDMTTKLWDAPFLTLGAAMIALGGLSIAHQDFAFQWQPVPPDVPARATLAVISGAAEILVGLTLFVRGWRDKASYAASGIFWIWTALHVPVLLQRPTDIGAWLGFAECLAIALALLLAPLRASERAVRAIVVTIGLTFIVFGTSHLAYPDFAASMIPTWIPQRLPLAYFTGPGHVAAGLALVSSVLRSKAAFLEAVMMTSFIALVHAPRLMTQPGDRMEWTMFWMAVVLTSSVWLVARHYLAGKND